MSTRATLRRRVAGIVATAVAASALALIPINLGAANATTTPQAAAMSWLNEDRVDGGTLDAFLDNGFLDDWVQGVAANVVACSGCANPDYPTWVLGNTYSNWSISYAQASGGAIADRPGRIASDFEQGAATNAFSDAQYGAIGIVTKGTTSYGVLITISFPSAPENETRVGTVKLPSVIRASVPIIPVIAGFSPLPTSDYSFIWQVNGVDKGFSHTYTPVGADVGLRVKALVYEENAGYSLGQADSALSSKVLAGTVHAPASISVFGLRNVGQQLSVSTGGWTPVVPTIQWYRNGVKIVGQTGTAYSQVALDRGKKISVRLTDVTTGYVALTKSSSTSIVTGYPLLAIAPYPSVGGSPFFGFTLFADTNPWGPGTVKLTYQWRAEGKAIPGATHASLLLGAGLLGSSISVTVTGSEKGYATTARSSSATPDVRLLPFGATTVPTLTGSLAHGTNVTATVAPWTPAATLYLYTWYLEGVVVSHAKTYKLPVNSSGKTIKVVVIGMRPGYQPQQYASSAAIVS